MKQISIILVLVCYSIIGQAQTNTFPSTGNVGIGTTTPSGAQLYIKSAGTSPFLAIDKNVNEEGGIQWRKANSIMFYFYSDNTDGDALKIQSSSENDFSPRIHIPYTNNNLYLVESGGTVTMGHKNPYSSSRLHVKSPAPSQWGFITEASANQRIVGLGHDGNAGYISVSYLGTAGYSPLYFRTSEQTQMTLDVNGYFGIGQNAPQARVHISEGDLLLQNSTTGYPRLFLKDVSGFNTLKLDYNSLVSTGGMMYIQTSAAQPIVLNRTGGNVGIGTSSPTETLTVNGKIYGKEVKVDLNVPGPDYVFDHSYDLRSLDELKSYVDEHKHLPEVPSAKEMEKNGVNVGDMEMVLLKKIEELTLYVIELKKKSDRQEEMIQQLSQKK